MPSIARPAEHRFWEWVSKDGPTVRPELGPCWEWQAARLRNGYGQFKDRSYHNVLAHRYAYQRFVGPIPPGLHVMHRCDNRACVRPDHLTVGTWKDNSADMVAKGRHYSITQPEAILRGEAHGRAKLTEAAVLDIRRRCKEVGPAALAREYGVSATAIRLAAIGRNWRSIGGNPTRET